MRVASIELSPLNGLFGCTIDEPFNCTGGAGFFIEPMKYLAKKLNFTIQFIYSVDGKWGGQDGDGVWNGMIGMLVRVGLGCGFFVKPKNRIKPGFWRKTKQTKPKIWIFSDFLRK